MLQSLLQKFAELAAKHEDALKRLSSVELDLEDHKRQTRDKAIYFERKLVTHRNAILRLREENDQLRSALRRRTNHSDRWEGEFDQGEE